jgi:hypothetical protein
MKRLARLKLRLKSDQRELDVTIAAGTRPAGFGKR